MTQRWREYDDHVDYNQDLYNEALMESSLAYDRIEEYRDYQANISRYIRPDIRPIINTMYRDWRRVSLRLMSLRDKSTNFARHAAAAKVSGRPTDIVPNSRPPHHFLRARDNLECRLFNIGEQFDLVCRPPGFMSAWNTL
jgi:hypothetical protein